MRFLVFGSLNIDRTYSVEHFVSAGETLSASKMELFCGGKGFNQAVALARAGRQVYMAGAVGADGQMLLDALEADGIDSRYLKRTAGASGHAVIQVDPQGQNCILILAGANGELSREDVDRVLANFEKGDLIVLQNELPIGPYILEQAAKKGMVTALNPSPCDGRIAEYDLRLVDYLLVNEVEGQAITGCTEPEQILDRLHGDYPNMHVVLTLGSQGSCYCGPEGKHIPCGIFKTHAVDTTAAGDTYAGYFLAEMTAQGDAAAAMKLAAVASGISVSRKGASPSIPKRPEVLTAGSID